MGKSAPTYATRRWVRGVWAMGSKWRIKISCETSDTSHWSSLFSATCYTVVRISCTLTTFLNKTTLTGLFHVILASVSFKQLPVFLNDRKREKGSMFIGWMFSLATPHATRPFPEITFKDESYSAKRGVVKVSDLVRRLISAFFQHYVHRSRYLSFLTLNGKSWQNLTER